MTILVKINDKVCFCKLSILQTAIKINVIILPVRVRLPFIHLIYYLKQNSKKLIDNSFSFSSINKQLDLGSISLFCHLNNAIFSDEMSSGDLYLNTSTFTLLKLYTIISKKYWCYSLLQFFPILFPTIFLNC